VVAAVALELQVRAGKDKGRWRVTMKLQVQRQGGIWGCCGKGGGGGHPV